MFGNQRAQAARRRRDQAEVSQVPSVSCLASLSTAKHLEASEELEMQAWIKFSETSARARVAPVHDDDAALERLMNETGVHCVIPDDDDDSYLQEVTRAVVEERKLRVAIDSGSVDNVVNPNDLPENIHVEPNAPGTKHFKVANDSRLERFGTIETTLKQAGKAAIKSDWVGADVSRALYSVSKVCGKPVAPKQDVLLNASK